jgi:hypothetical protein
MLANLEASKPNAHEIAQKQNLKRKIINQVAVCIRLYVKICIQAKMQQRVHVCTLVVGKSTTNK